MPITNTPLSYTNKDFQAIYEELLEVAKKLSYKWDPTISNESDPGVVLLKLNAIIADKNNYNIDKNILETYVDTVTQDVTARQLFNQLGYKMPSYNAASTDIVFTWIGDKLTPDQVINIPKFSMVTDKDNSVLYTLIEPVQITALTEDYTVSAPALQGNIIHHTVAGSKLITTVNFDENNRLFLNDSQVAQNGIFVTNADDTAIEWTLVDNIQLYPTGSYVFEFNVDARTGYTYLEFPEDYHNLIGSGIYVSYVATTGFEGNIAARVIEAFADNITCNWSSGSVILSNENMVVYNNAAATNGSNPQSIDDAFRSYKRVVGTFNTLVTLRDYINAIYNSELVSNVQVSDRLNDIQTSFTIVTDDDAALSTVYRQKKVSDKVKYSFINAKTLSGDKPLFSSDTFYCWDDTTKQMKMMDETTFDSVNINNIYRLVKEEDIDLTAYDLRLYMLCSPQDSVIKDLSSYNKSFDLIDVNDENQMSRIKNYINNTKCVQHNYKDILSDRFCLFTNVYPLDIKIIPQYKLNLTQIDDLKKRIFNTLITNINSRKITFGEEPNYDTIYNMIMSCDSRIKAIILDDFVYTTFATYWDSAENKFKKIPVSEFDRPNIIQASSIEEANVKLQAVKETAKGYEYYIIINNPDEGIYNHCYITTAEKGLQSNSEPYSTFIQEFRKEIIARSVLAGITPLFSADNRFKYTIDKKEEEIIEDVDRITTEVIICPFNPEDDLDEDDYDGDEENKILNPDPVTSIGEGNDSSIAYEVPENVSVSFYAPAFKNDVNYSNYVKFMLVLNDATGWEYVQKSIDSSTVISANNPVYIHIYDEATHSYRWDMYITNQTVTGDDGTRGSILDLVLDNNLTVYDKVKKYAIPSDTDYKLRPGDYIVFFWKESSDDNAPYTYKIYRGITDTSEEKSPIINANFTIQATDANNAPLKSTRFTKGGDSGIIEYNPAANSEYTIVNNFYGDTDLSGTKAINIRNMDAATIKANTYSYYFITNKIEYNPNDKKDHYKLPLVPTYLDKEKTQIKGYGYTLRDDEYFIYTKINSNTFEVLGSGTYIEFKNTHSGNDVVAIEADNILEGGLPSFIDASIFGTTDLTVRVQQLYNFTDGDTIYLSLTEDYYDSKVVVDNYNADGTSLPSFKITKDKNEAIISSSINVSVNDEDVFYSVSTEDDGIVVTPFYIPNMLKLDDSGEYLVNTVKEETFVSTNSTFYNLENNNYYKVSPAAASGGGYYYYQEFTSLESEKSEYNGLVCYEKLNSDYKLTSYDSTSNKTYFKAIFDSPIKVCYFDENLHKDWYVLSENDYIKLTNGNIEVHRGNNSNYVIAYRLYYFINPESDAETLYSVEGPEITYTYSYKKLIETSTPKISSNEMTSMKGIDISYELAGSDSTITKLPALNLSDDLSWNATATYNISSSYEDSQTIPKQNKRTSVRFLVNVNGEVEDYASNTQEKQFNTSATVSKVGGENIDVSYVDLFGNRQKIAIMIYEYNDKLHKKDSNISVDTSGNIYLNMNQGVTLETQLNIDREYNYILPISNVSDSGSYKINISNATPAYTDADNKAYLYDIDGQESFEYGTQYFAFKSNSTDNQILSISIDTEDKNARLVIHPLLKYKDVESFQEFGLTTVDIVAKMRELDVNNEFKYNYTVPNDVKIENPLLAKEFLDNNHICNKFTISKAELDFNNVANKSELEVVSNR